MRQKLLLVVAVFFGLMAFYLSHRQLEQMKQQIRGSTVELDVVTLRRDLAEGDTIAAGDIEQTRVQRFPKDVSDNDVRWERRADIVGQKLGRVMKAGEMVRYSDLAAGRRRDGRLAGIVKPGYRAISISVDATASVTGLVQPNDNVDLIGTFRFPDMKGDQALDTLTLTLLQNVRVMATGTDIGNTDLGVRRSSKGYSTVSLELTPKEVEMIVFASQKGRLTLSLRHTEETRIETDLQSVNFRYLEENIPVYTQERQRRTVEGRR